MEVELGGKKILINNTVLKIFSNFRQVKNNKKESGGILLGRIHNKNLFSLTKVSTPNMFDKAKRCNFIRNKKAAQIIIDFEFYNSLGKTIYLGEWHTHPENHPNPSEQDYLMLKEQFSKNNLNTNEIILIIQGIKYVYVGLYNGSKIYEKHVKNEF